MLIFCPRINALKMEDVKLALDRALVLWTVKEWIGSGNRGYSDLNNQPDRSKFLTLIKTLYSPMWRINRISRRKRMLTFLKSIIYPP